MLFMRFFTTMYKAASRHPALETFRDHLLVVLGVVLALFLLQPTSVIATTTTNGSPTPTPTPSPTPTVVKQFKSEVVSTNATINLSQYFSNIPVASSNNVLSNTVLVNSSMGNFYIQLFPTNAPKTVANFLEYVNTGTYTNLFIHRSVPGFVIQTGGFYADSSLDSVPTFETVNSEFGIPNTAGTVAMALVGTDSNSATGQWFINLTNNTSILDATNTSGNPPFTVFGQVIGNGMSVVDAIAALPIDDFTGPPLYFGNGAFSTVPLQNWTDTNSIALDNIVSITNILTLPYFAVSSNTNEYLAQIQGTNLIVRYVGIKGNYPSNPVTITAYASDTNGHIASSSFEVSNQKLYQTINFPNIYASYTNGSFSFPSFPTASSGLGVSVVLKSGPAIISNGQLRLTGVGVVTLSASQTGNAIYYPAPPATGYLIIGEASQTITFPKIPNITNYTTASSFTLAASNYPVSSSALPVTLTVGAGPATYNSKTRTVTVNGTGTVSLVASQSGNANFYAAQPVINSFTVTPKPTPTPSP